MCAPLSPTEFLAVPQPHGEGAQGETQQVGMTPSPAPSCLSMEKLHFHHVFKIRCSDKAPFRKVSFQKAPEE